MHSYISYFNVVGNGVAVLFTYFIFVNVVASYSFVLDNNIIFDICPLVYKPVAYSFAFL